MSAKRVLVYAAMFVSGFTACYLIRGPARARTPTNWPVQVPQQLVVSYPEKDGRVSHILRVNGGSMLIQKTTFDSSAWRVNLTTQDGVWILECEKVGSDFVR